MTDNAGPPRITGHVEKVGRTGVEGWCRVEGQESPAALRLFLGDISICTRRADLPVTAGNGKGHPQGAGFHFKIGSQLRRLVPEDARVRVVVDGTTIELPHAENVKMFPGLAKDNGNELREKLAAGCVVNHWGYLANTFRSDPGKRERLLDAYCGLRKVFDSLGHDFYLTGGNLLGLTRQSEFLEHDSDIDASVCLSAATPEKASDALFQFLDRFTPLAVANGYRIETVNPGQFHVSMKGSREHVDVLVGWLTPEGNWYRRTRFGGNLGLTEFRTREISYLGRSVLVPEHAEKELELTYGPSWRVPDPHYVRQVSAEVDENITRFISAAKDRWKRYEESLPEMYRLAKNATKSLEAKRK